MSPALDAVDTGRFADLAEQSQSKKMRVRESQATTVAAPFLEIADSLEYDLTRRDTDVGSPQQSESDTESVGHNCMVGTLPRRRLRLTWNVPGAASASHRDTRAVNLFEQLTGRIGAIPVGRELPRALRQQRWSPVNVLLIWVAAGDDDTNPVLEWFGERAQGMQEVVPFHGGQTEPSQTLRLGWVALREVFRNWGVRTREDLTNWLGTHGHPRSSPGSHLAARTQEFILSAACDRDARVALLEAVFAVIVVDMGRAIAVPSCPHPVSRVPMITRRGQVLVPTEITTDSWGQLDQVDLDEIFLMRVPILKNCPHFLRGRLRFCFFTALRERLRAKMANDRVGEARAWKLFGLVPMMLLHRPKHTGSVGRDELAQRADDFARAAHQNVQADFPLPRAGDDKARRGLAAQSRVQRGQVSRARHELTGTPLAPKSEATL